MWLQTAFVVLQRSKSGNEKVRFQTLVFWIQACETFRVSLSDLHKMDHSNEVLFGSYKYEWVWAYFYAY